MDLFDDDFSRTEFNYVEKVNSVRREANVTINKDTTLTDLAYEFRNFLHAIGYTYVDAVVVVKDSGDEVSSED